MQPAPAIHCCSHEEVYFSTASKMRRWGLKPDYPMVAPTYSAKRQALAKEIGLGRKPAPPPAPELEPKPRRRGKATA